MTCQPSENSQKPETSIDNSAVLPQISERVTIFPELCKACGLCIVNCPRNVLEKGTLINTMGYQATVAAHAENCIGCGFCFYICPEPGAVAVQKK